jgi:hypothetical protein
MGSLGAITVGLLLGVGSVDGGAGARGRLEQFIPQGWETGECPKAYGLDSVLCGATDQGPFKVDHHVPTAWIRVPHRSCKEAREGSRRDAERKGFTLSAETVGRCGSPAAPCVEHVYRGRSADAARGFEYVLCPSGGHSLIVSYGVSSRVADAFHDLARRQVRWADGHEPLTHSDSIQIGPEASLEGVAGDPVLDVVRSHRPEIERCRADAVAAGRVPVGKLVLKWQIGADGRVASAETASDDTNDRTLASCVLARLRTWQFPRPKGGGAVFITCPFQFRPAG